MTDHPISDRLLSAGEVADYLGVTRDTVYGLIKRNGLPSVKVGRLWKFRRSEIEKWVDAQPRRKTPGNGEPPEAWGKPG